MMAGAIELNLVGIAMETSPHIAVVDDHHDIRDLVGQYLTRHGYRVSLAESGETLREILARETIDLIVLDIMMPGEDGISICRQLRASMATPIIFLTAMSEDTDRIVGLEIGADDYLVKPFNPRELLARVRAVLRRVQGTAARQSEPIKGSTIRFDQWTLDFARQELTDSDGIGVALSTVEFRLLKAFLDHPGMVLSRDQLLDLTSGRTADPFDRSIDNQVSRLRKKVEADPKNPAIIKTHWGGGYSLSASVVKS
jgi:two-component system OmpR family response regulator